MKKILLLFTFILSLFSANAWTVYFKNLEGWDVVYCYVLYSDGSLQTFENGVEVNGLWQFTESGPDPEMVTFGNYHGAFMPDEPFQDNYIYAPHINFGVNGLTYQLIDFTLKTCQLVTNGGNYPATIVVPAQVSFDNQDYKVVGVNLGREMNLTKITLGQNVETFSFNMCSNLKTVEFSPAVKKIPRQAFQGCSNLEEINLPNTIESIEDYAFYECTALKYITIPSSVTMGNGVFYECISLRDVEIPNVTFMSNAYNFFYNCPLEKISLNCKKIPSGLLEGQTKLKHVTLGENIEEIYSSFHSCPLETIFINCASLPNQLFASIPTLREVDFGDNVKLIGRSTFYECTGLEKVRIHDLEKWLQIDFEGTNPLQYAHHLYLDDTEVTDLTIPSSITSIGPYAMAGCLGLKTLVIPETVTSIGSCAFSETGISSIVIPTSITTLEGTFIGCSNLVDVTLPESITTLDCTFLGCPNLVDVTLPESITTLIGAFCNCSALAEINLPNSIIDIADSFYGCSALKKIRIPEKVKVIQSYAFGECSSLESVTFSKELEEVGQYAFVNCVSLKSITIPSGVKIINRGTFTGCKSLIEAIMPNTVTEIKSYAFDNCQSLSIISLGTGMFKIEGDAFEGCDNISIIYCLAQNPPYAESNTFPSIIFNKATLYVQEQALSAYTRQDPWQRFTKVNTVNSGIQLSHYEVNMAGNQVFQLGVYGSDNKVTWSASNPDVAYANECGLVVGRGVTGSSIITATVDGVCVSCRVNVTSPRQVKGTRASEDEDIQPVDIIIESIGGNPPMVNARLIPVGSKTVIDWSSSNSSVATVEDGLVTIISEGNVDFGAETGNGLEDNYDINTEDIDLSRVIVIENPKTLSNDIYNLQGIRVKHNASKCDIDTLTPGIYIIGGKKVIVR